MLLPVLPKMSYPRLNLGPPTQSQPDQETIEAAEHQSESQQTTIPISIGTTYLDGQVRDRLNTISRTEVRLIDEGTGAQLPADILLMIAEKAEIADEELFSEANTSRVEIILKNDLVSGSQKSQMHTIRQAFEQKKIGLLYSILTGRRGGELQKMLLKVAGEKPGYAGMLTSMKKLKVEFKEALDHWCSPAIPLRKMLEGSSEQRAIIYRIAFEEGGEYADALEATPFSFETVDLRGQDLTGIKNHRGIRFESLDLSAADLSDGYFSKQVSQHRDWGHIHGNMARVFGGDLSRTKFIRSNCSGCTFSGKLIEADMSHANASRAKFSGSDLTHATMTGMIGHRSIFHNATLTRAIMENAQMTGAEFNGAILAFADMRKADISGAKVDDAVFDGADLRGSTLTGVKLWKCKSWNGMIIDQAALNTLDLISKQLVMRAIGRGEVFLASAENRINHGS